MPDERDPAEDSADLFDRWLAHREGTEPEAPRPRTYGVPRTSRTGRPEGPGEPGKPEEQAESRLDEPGPAAPAHPAPAAAPRQERPTAQGPVGLEEFEPVVIASVRRAAQAPDRTTPRARLSRARRRAEPEPGGTDQADATPALDEAQPDQPQPDQPDPTQPEPTRPERDRPEPELPEAEATGSEQAAQPATTPTPPTTAATPTVTDATDTDTTNDGATPATGGPPRPWLSKIRTGTETARARLDRAVHGTPEERNAATRAPAAAPPKHLAKHPATHPAHQAGSAYEELRAQREAAVPAYPVVEPPSIDFRPRMTARILTSVLLVAGLVATGAAGWQARDSRSATDVGLLAVLALLTGVVWAVRAGTVPTRVSLHGGRLEAQTQDGRFLFDLSSEHTRLEMLGSPGRRGWKVLVHRRGLSPFAFTRRMVDPHQLTDALRFYRPDL